MADPIVLIAGCAVIFLAGVTSGLTGFGFALVTVPLLVIFLPPKTVVPIISLLSNLSHIIILVETAKWIDLKRIWLLTIAGIVGIPLGTYLLLLLDANTLKIMIGCVTTVSAIALLAGFGRPVQSEKLALAPIGFASGLLGGSTGMGGPPVILFFSNQGVEKQVFRANLTAFFTILSLVTIPTQWLGGLLTREVLVYSGWFLPALLVGTWLGVKLARQVSEPVFRKITLSVVIMTGLSAMAFGLGLL